MFEQKYFELKNVYVRYEPNIEGGTVFVFNRDTGNMFEGNSDLYNVISLIQDGYSSDDIHKAIRVAYDMSEGTDKLVDTVLEKLLSEDIIEIR